MTRLLRLLPVRRSRLLDARHDAWYWRAEYNQLATSVGLEP